MENIEPQEQNNTLMPDKIRSILESLLFVNERPIETKELADIAGISKKEVENILDTLSEGYKQRTCGITIVKIAGGYQMCSVPDNELWVKKMYQERSKQKLSIAALETLAIIAYKQPITKMEIEAIRGVNADGVTKNLTNFGLIKIEGRKEVVGRPFLYITTRKFLEYFGLDTLKDLPKLEEFIALAEKDKIVESVVTEANAVEVSDLKNGELVDESVATQPILDGPAAVKPDEQI
jgi:segregation and condensation protein B